MFHFWSISYPHRFSISCSLDCPEEMDLVLVLDSSEAVGYNRFVNHFLEFTKSLVRNVDVTHDKTRVGLITMATQANIVFNLNTLALIQHFVLSKHSILHLLKSQYNNLVILSDRTALFKTIHFNFYKYMIIIVLYLYRYIFKSYFHYCNVSYCYYNLVIFAKWSIFLFWESLSTLWIMVQLTTALVVASTSCKQGNFIGWGDLKLHKYPAANFISALIYLPYYAYLPTKPRHKWFAHFEDSAEV